jgi:hypothetical protein
MQELTPELLTISTAYVLWTSERSHVDLFLNYLNIRSQIIAMRPFYVLTLLPTLVVLVAIPQAPTPKAIEASDDSSPAARLLSESTQQPTQQPLPNATKPYDYVALAKLLGKAANDLRNANASATRGLNFTGLANIMENLSKGLGSGDLAALNPFAMVGLAGQAASDLASSALGNVFDPLHLGKLPKAGNQAAENKQGAKDACGRVSVSA